MYIDTWQNRQFELVLPDGVFAIEVKQLNGWLRWRAFQKNRFCAAINNTRNAGCEARGIAYLNFDGVCLRIRETAVRWC